MPERGPVQLLLLLLRTQLRQRRGVSALTIGAVTALALLPAGDGAYSSAKMGLTQLVRQSAWERALSGDPEPMAWPWSDTLAERTSSVPILGLSAAVEPGDDAELAKPVRSARLPNIAAAADAAADPHLVPGKSPLGDHVIVTVAGPNPTCKFGGRKLERRAAAEGDGLADTHPGIVDCGSLDPLVARVLRMMTEAVELPNSPEQKL